jgi:putative ABC transport system permease protein
MFPRSSSDLTPPDGYVFGPRISLPAKFLSLRFLRLAAIWEAFFVALRSLRQNKLRTALTLIGIIVGVTAVIAVVTIIKGLDQTVAQTFSSQGSTVFTISKRPRVITSREEFIKFNKRKDVTEDDAHAIFRLCTACWRTGIGVDDSANIKHDNQKNENTRIRAITPTTMFDVDGVTIDVGRFWNDSEGESAHEVCVVGPDIVTNMFPNQSSEQVLGQELWVGGRTYRIIGVLQPLGKLFGISRDNKIFIPFATYKKNFGLSGAKGAFTGFSIIVISIQTQTADQLEAAQDQVRAIMRNRRGKSFGDDDDGFALETEDVFLNLYSSATSNIYLVTIGVAAISLVVGGIVVMNIMLVSVTERTKEIGIRKAVGARQKDIRIQFLIEAVMVTAIGGIFGVLTGFATAWLIALAIGFPLLFSLWSAVLGVGVSSVVGVISGLWPAWRAARLDPIEALRAE